MRPDVDYLTDVVEYSDVVGQMLRGVQRDAFVADDTLRSAVTYKLLIIGEAVARLSDDVKRRWPEVPWSQIAGFRNRIVHGYFATDYDIVYAVATRQLKELGANARRIVSELNNEA